MMKRIGVLLVVLCFTLVACRYVPKMWRAVFRSAYVDMTIVPGSHRCTGTPEHPVLIEVHNGSNYTVSGVRFWLETRAPEHSTNLTQGQEFKDDRLIPPGNTTATCWRIFDHAKIDSTWSVKYVERIVDFD